LQSSTKSGDHGETIRSVLLWHFGAGHSHPVSKISQLAVGRFIMSPLVWAMIAVVVILGIAALVSARQAEQEKPKPSVVADLEPARVWSPTLETVRMRTQYEVETDEDLAVIEEVYREDRRSKRAQLALERLAAITPSTPSSKK
jgi:hypothetical protein